MRRQTNPAPTFAVSDNTNWGQVNFHTDLVGATAGVDLAPCIFLTQYSGYLMMHQPDFLGANGIPASIVKGKANLIVCGGSQRSSLQA
jgi:hypothetical protein